MSLGPELLQTWLTLRSSTRREQTFWDNQRRQSMLADLVRGDGKVRSKNGTNTCGLIESTPGKGTRVTLPLDLLTARQQREAKGLSEGQMRISVDDPNVNYAELYKKAPSVIWADQALGGHLLGNGPSNHDLKILNETANATAEMASDPVLYYWGTDPLRAAMEASISLPPDSSIVADLYTELPRCGLWIFETPIQEQTTKQDFDVSGLLWRLSAVGVEMTALVRSQGDDAGLYRVGELAPTWSGWLPAEFPEGHSQAGESLTLRDLEKTSGDLYDLSYPDKGGLMGRDRSVATNLKLAKFWVAAVQWMQQRVLVKSRPSRVLPKNKKRARKMEQQVKGQMPTIEIIQLRRSERTPTTGTGTTRTYSIRFVVHGFWRNQWYAKRAVHAPKWIASYVKGPKDAPLKETIRGFSVTR